MKKFWIQIIILVLIIFGALYASFNRSILEPFLPPTNLSQTQIQVGESIFSVEVVDTATKRNKGLSGRESLATGSGMLFIFPETKVYQFWMKGMKFPLDMIFIREGKVVDVLKNIPNPSAEQSDQSLPIYQPIVPIDMMLEVNSGTLDNNNINIGDGVYLLK